MFINIVCQCQNGVFYYSIFGHFWTFLKMSKTPFAPETFETKKLKTSKNGFVIEMLT